MADIGVYIMTFRCRPFKRVRVPWALGNKRPKAEIAFYRVVMFN